MSVLVEPPLERLCDGAVLLRYDDGIIIGRVWGALIQTDTDAKWRYRVLYDATGRLRQRCDEAGNGISHEDAEVADQEMCETMRLFADLYGITGENYDEDRPESRGFSTRP